MKKRLLSAQPEVQPSPFFDFFAGRRVLVTGDTGFKGGWLCHWLLELGAEVTGIGLAPETTPALFELTKLSAAVEHHTVDICDAGRLSAIIGRLRPDVIFHLAAQALVRRSYREPVETLTTNVVGTANLLQAARLLADQGPRVIVAITSDKCYENRGLAHAFAETDALGGDDPYSASKAGAEITIAAWRRAFFSAPDATCRLASARAGNVIGGGDWAEDRIVPDCVRALQDGRTISVRNPHARRPWQHVLEPLSGYLTLAAQIGISAEPRYCEAWNFGPAPEAERSVGELCDAIVRHWGNGSWQHARQVSPPHEATTLKLSSKKASEKLGWRPVWDFDRAVAETVAWYRSVAQSPGQAGSECRRQIAAYLTDATAAGVRWAAGGSPEGGPLG